MAYATEDDCRLHAPQAPTGDDFAGHIAQAEGVADSRLRASFIVPLSVPIPQLVTNIVSRLAAGRYLEAMYSKINQEPPEYAGNLIDGAMSDLDKLMDDPSVLGIPLRPVTEADRDADPVKIAETTGGYFHSRNPRDWGR